MYLLFKASRFVTHSSVHHATAPPPPFEVWHFMMRFIYDDIWSALPTSLFESCLCLKQFFNGNIVGSQNTLKQPPFCPVISIIVISDFSLQVKSLFMYAWQGGGQCAVRRKDTNDFVSHRTTTDCTDDHISHLECSCVLSVAPPAPCWEMIVTKSIY